MGGSGPARRRNRGMAGVGQGAVTRGARQHGEEEARGAAGEQSGRGVRQAGHGAQTGEFQAEAQQDQRARPARHGGVYVELSRLGGEAHAAGKRPHASLDAGAQGCEGRLADGRAAALGRPPPKAACYAQPPPAVARREKTGLIGCLSRKRMTFGNRAGLLRLFRARVWGSAAVFY